MKKKLDQEAWSEDEFTQPKKGSNPFFCIPTIPSFKMADSGPECTHSLGYSDAIKCFQTFNTKEDLILVVKMKAIREKFQIKTKRSTKQRYDVVCIIEGCPWRLYAVPYDVESKVFHVRIFVDQHNCTLLQLHPNHKQANTDVLGTVVHDTMGKNYGRVWRPNDIAKDLNTRFQVNVTYKQAWRAKHYAYELFTGSPEESFAQLPIYFHYLKQHNPGTLAYIETDSEDRFEHCFFALGCSVNFLL